MAFWYELLLKIEYVSAVIVFITLYFINAPYGRYASSKWGPTIPSKAGWVIMELPAVVIPLLFYMFGNRGSVLMLFLIIWELHYIQRTFVFSFLMRSGRKMPLIIVVLSLLFNGMNGVVNGYGVFVRSSYTREWLFSLPFVAGVLLFLIGFVINVHSDHVMRTLRKPGETDYKIPHRGLHRFVANPNYFGELLEWGGWAILTWSSAGLAFFLFTAANLVPRAHANLRWYRTRFSDYPEERKRIIPFIY